MINRSRRLSDIITRPEDGALPLTLQYMRCARAQGISYGILVEYMPAHVRTKGYGQVILRKVVPVGEQIKAGLQAYQWFSGMNRSLDAFLDIAYDATWETGWTPRRIESACLAQFFAADCLVGDVLAQADYFTRRMPSGAHCAASCPGSSTARLPTSTTRPHAVIGCTKKSARRTTGWRTETSTIGS